jgi:type II secretory ATPase GspE/PulE/Tfp pilus assembly ATPase PilB-like protein
MPDQMAIFERLISAPNGIILVTGPTGSGKTTTLYAALNRINSPDKNIITIEDPVEYQLQGVGQIQVNNKIGLTFAKGLRSIVRQDPDVILVGEVRDAETAEISIHAALTGHLVFSTLHTNSAVETVTRLLEMGMDPFNFADALLGVLAQRLCKTLCKECKEKYHPPKEAFDELAHAYGEEAFEKLGYTYDDNFMLYRPKGCEVCKNTGLKGRTGLHELLVGTDQIKRLIQKRTTAEDLLKVAKEEGLATLVQDGVIKVINGWTDFKQVKAVAIK